MTTTSTIFRAGESHFASYRIPALITTPSGVLVALCEGRWQLPDDHKLRDIGDINIMCRRSTDGGRTWGKLIEVLSQGHDTAGNPTVVVDPSSGDLVLVSCRNPADKGRDRTVFVQRGIADGTTWSKAVEITAQVKQPDWRWYATGPGRGAVLTSGPHKNRIVIPANHTTAPDGNAGAHLIFSDDGGRTWAIGAVSESDRDKVSENENAITVLPDGATLYASCRCGDDTAPGNRANTFSHDGGLTFTGLYKPQLTIVTPQCQGSLLTLPDGRLLYAGPSHPDKRRAIALRLSTDQGKTWKTTQKISDLPAGYSSLTLIDKKTVGLLYETGARDSAERIDFRAIPLTDLH